MSLKPGIFRILLPTIIVSSLLLAVGGGGAWYVQRLQRQSNTILAVNVASIRAAEELEISVREIRSVVSSFLLTGDMNHLNALPSLRKDAEQWFGEAERASISPEEKRLIRSIQEGLQHLYREIDELPEEARHGTSRAEARRLALDLMPNEILVHTKEFLDFNERELAHSNVENQKLADRLVLGLLLLGSCGCVAGLSAGYGLARGLSRGIVRLTVPIRDVAGTLEEVVGPMTVEGSPDLNDLEAVMHGIADRVTTVVRQLQQSQREALHAEQLASLGQLAAGLAHELRNPLMSMKILVQAAAEEVPSGVLEGKDLKVLEDEMDRMEGLVQSFLDFARPPTPNRRRVQWQPLVEQTLELLSFQIRRGSATLVTNFPAEPLWVSADPGQLRQQMLNLVLNSLDAMPDGGRLTITLRREFGGENAAVAGATLSVTDSGLGMTPAVAEKAFEPFFSTKTTGLGLGLAVCQRISEAHGGRISVREGPGHGAEFVVWLPLADAGDTASGET